MTQTERSASLFEKSHIFFSQDFLKRLAYRGDVTASKTKSTHKNRHTITKTYGRDSQSDLWSLGMQGQLQLRGAMGSTAGANGKTDCWNKQVAELLVGSESLT